MKKSDIIAGALAELDDDMLNTAAEQKQNKRSDLKRLLPGLCALFACVMAGLVMLPLIRPLLQKGDPAGSGTDTYVFPIIGSSAADSRGSYPEEEPATFDERLMKYMPDKEPEYKDAPSYLYYTGIDADAFVKGLCGSGFTVLCNGRTLYSGVMSTAQNGMNGNNGFGNGGNRNRRGW